MSIEILNETFNNREIALFFYMMIFIIWMLFTKDIRKSLVNLLKQFFVKEVLILTSCMLAYTYAILFFLSTIKLWDSSMTKEAIYWIFGVGIIILFNSNEVIKEESYFKKIIAEKFKLLIIIEFIVGLYLFGLLFELILMPIVILFSLLLGYTDVHKEHEEVRKFIDLFFGILGFTYLLYSGYNIYNDVTSFATYDNLRLFLFPIFMTFLFIPFAYFIALFIQYEVLFLKIKKSFKDDEIMYRYAKWRVLLSVNISFVKLRRFIPGHLFWGCKTKDDINKFIDNKLDSTKT